MRHRQDIDGLRAVAVVPIVLFHAGLDFLSGGFVGVDVFFVISGYLITSIIVQEMDLGRFSLITFYHRRIVRILPALMVMLVAALTVGWFFLLPTDLSNLSQSALASAVFASNIYFFFQTNYFAPAAETHILLHTWSLGVEEQFYIIYPIFILLIRHVMPRQILLILFITVLLSFAGSMWISLFNGGAAFYLIPSRVWELGLGGLVALGGAPRVTNAITRQLLALSGLLIILTSVVFIRAQWMFPAPWALLPCMGSALLIAYGEIGITARLLSLAVVRWLGKISYSLYLWHWPIITFYRMETGFSLNYIETLAISVLSLVVATASYHFVEKTFLTQFRNASRLGTAGAAGASIGSIVLASLLIPSAAAFQANQKIANIDSYLSYEDTFLSRYQFRDGVCFATRDMNNIDAGRCLNISRDRRNIVILGDSFAAQIWRALSIRFNSDNILQLNASGCKPLFKAVGRTNCVSLMERGLREVIKSDQIKHVILAARWNNGDIPKIRRTIKVLQRHDIEITLVGPGVEYDGDFPRILANALQDGDLNKTARLRRREILNTDSALREVAEELHLRYISLQDLECPNDRCKLLTEDGVPYHFDYGHLTYPASVELVSQMPTL